MTESEAENVVVDPAVKEAEDRAYAKQVIQKQLQLGELHADVMLNRLSTDHVRDLVEAGRAGDLALVRTLLHQDDERVTE